MAYPYSLLNQGVKVHSLIGDKIREGVSSDDFKNSQPMLFDFSGNNPDLWEMDIADQNLFQEYINGKMLEANANWAVAGYLEKRDSLLRDLPQMVGEKRFFHLGIDIILPEGTFIHLPIDGEVVDVGFESGKGNFGGFVLIKHNTQISGEPFYSLWGHLRINSLPPVGTFVHAGESFAQLGDMLENGNWFYHTHLQILTQKGYENDFVSKGYCTEEMLKEIDQYCPNPLFLLQY